MCTASNVTWSVIMRAQTCASLSVQNAVKHSSLSTTSRSTSASTVVRNLSSAITAENDFRTRVHLAVTLHQRSVGDCLRQTELVLVAMSLRAWIQVWTRAGSREWVLSVDRRCQCRLQAIVWASFHDHLYSQFQLQCIISSSWCLIHSVSRRQYHHSTTLRRCLQRPMDFSILCIPRIFPLVWLWRIYLQWSMPVRHTGPVTLHIHLIQVYHLPEGLLAASPLTVSRHVASLLTVILGEVYLQ